MRERRADNTILIYGKAQNSTILCLYIIVCIIRIWCSNISIIMLYTTNIFQSDSFLIIVRVLKVALSYKFTIGKEGNTVNNS